jgi:hypothetical protein
MAQTGILAAFLMPQILLFSDHPNFSKTWCTDILKKGSNENFQIQMEGFE